MSGAAELREVMCAFDPGWSLDVEQVRIAAVRARRRSRARRTIVAAIALVAATVGTGSVYANQDQGVDRRAPVVADADRSASRPAVSRSADRTNGDGSLVPAAGAPSSPGAESSAPEATVASSLNPASHVRREGASLSGLSGEQIAALSTRPVVRSGRLAKTGGGQALPIGWESAAVQLMVVPSQGSDAPLFCTRGATGKAEATADPDSACTSVSRDRDGWLAQRRWDDREWAVRAGLRLVEAPRVWVIDAPLSRVVVTYGGGEVSTIVHDLGGGYLAVTALVPLSDKGGFLPGVQAWGVDDHGIVVAYSQD